MISAPEKNATDPQASRQAKRRSEVKRTPANILGGPHERTAKRHGGKARRPQARRKRRRPNESKAESARHRDAGCLHGGGAARVLRGLHRRIPAQAAFALPSGSPLDVAMPLCATIGAGMLTAAATRRLHGNRATDEARRKATRSHAHASTRPGPNRSRATPSPCSPGSSTRSLRASESTERIATWRHASCAVKAIGRYPRGSSTRKTPSSTMRSACTKKAQVGSRHEFEMLIRGNVEERIRRETEAQNETEESRGTEDRREQATARGAE